MARFNEILVGRYNRLFQKLLQIKGEAAVPVLSTELQPVLSAFQGVENRYLEGWDLFQWRLTQAAGGIGNTAAMRFRNPTGSNLLAVIEQIWFGGSLLDSPQWLLSAQTVDLATVLGPAGRLDRRTLRNSGLVMSQTGAGGGFGGNFQAFLLANTSLALMQKEDDELPLLPGDALDIEAGVANQAITVSVRWRERFLEESEAS